MFHQVGNSIGGQIYNAYLYRNIEWKKHIHKAFEFALVTNGNATAVVGGKDYSLCEGEGVVVLPYQPHSLKVEGKSRLFVVVFSEEFVQSFTSLISGKEAKCASITLDETTKNFVFSTFRISEASEGDYVGVEKPDTFAVKSALYAVCSIFNGRAQFVKRSYDNTLVYSILNYIETNFTADVSLLSLAKTIGYDHRYLSRVFSSTFKMNFKTLVNQYRCDYAKRLISTTQLSLSEVAFSSGFQSIRSFNRAFKDIMGFEPSLLRK